MLNMEFKTLEAVINYRTASYFFCFGLTISFNI